MYSHNRGANDSDGKFYGNFRGRVVSNQDPLEAGRCQIRFFSIFDDVDDDLLPWAEYADPFMGGDVDVGGAFIPDEGSLVWGWFDNGDFEKPVYFAGASAKTHGPSERTTGTYPRNKVFKTKAGHTIELDDSPGEERIKIKHKCGTYQEMFANGDVVEVVEGNFTRTVKGNILETVEGTLNQNIAGNATISSDGTAQINSGSGSVTLTDVFDINGIVFEDHTHPQKPDSGGHSQQDTDPPQ